jgi:fumarate reductase subunit D
MVERIFIGQRAKRPFGPDNWSLFAVGSLVALAVAAVLTIFIPRLYPWAAKQ